jgi:hypothetical protein
MKLRVPRVLLQVGGWALIVMGVIVYVSGVNTSLGALAGQLASGGFVLYLAARTPRT